jgi:hypothetical protein
VVDGNVEAQRLQQDVLVRHQLLSLFLKMYWQSLGTEGNIL